MLFCSSGSTRLYCFCFNFIGSCFLHGGQIVYFVDYPTDVPQCIAIMCCEKYKYCSLWTGKLYTTNCDGGRDTSKLSNIIPCHAAFVHKMQCEVSELSIAVSYQPRQGHRYDCFDMYGRQTSVYQKQIEALNCRLPILNIN